VKVCLDVVSRHSVVSLEEYVKMFVKVCQHEPPLLKAFVVLLWFYPCIGVSGLIVLLIGGAEEASYKSPDPQVITICGDLVQVIGFTYFLMSKDKSSLLSVNKLICLA
jgi:hypothetical protein